MEIFISGDVQRGNQSSNIRTLAALISDSIFRVSKIKPVVIHEAEALNEKAWAKSFDDSDFLLKKYGLDRNRLWIGFEFPVGFKRFCNQNGIPVIDFNAYSLRFCDDLFFGIDTTCDVSDWVVRDSEIRASATKIKGWAVNIPGVYTPENSVLLVGQTASDRSLIENGKIVSLNRYEDRLFEIFSGHDGLFVKAHPHGKISGEFIKNLESRLGKKIQRTELNIYKLLSESHISSVVGISSSVLAEAKYFDKRVYRLLERDINEVYRPVCVDVVVSESFWVHVLSQYGVTVVDNGNLKERILVIRQNALRNIFNSGWGYPFFKRADY